MWRPKSKSGTGAKKWHTKAMLVDPKKTRIIMTWSEITNENDTARNLETEEPNMETAEKDLNSTESSDSVESPTSDFSENPVLETKVEPPKTREPLEELTIEPDVIDAEPKSVAPPVENTETNIGLSEPNLMEATSACETTETTLDLPKAHERANAKFLRALEKTRILWDNDKQFTKIVQKMQKGKNLKRKEFDKVYFYIQEYLQYC